MESRFLETPDKSNQTESILLDLPRKVKHCKFTPDFSNSRSLESVSPLELREIRVPLYNRVHGTCLQVEEKAEHHLCVEYYSPGASVGLGLALGVDECGIVGVGSEIKISYKQVITIHFNTLHSI